MKRDEIEYRKFQRKRKYLSISDDKKFSLGNIRFENERLSSILQQIVSPVIHDPYRKLETRPPHGQKHGRREEEGRKKNSPGWKSFENASLCRPLKEAKAIEVSLNKLQKTSFPTLF